MKQHANIKRSNVVAQMVRRGSVQEQAFDRDFWRNAGHEVRFAASWEMIRELSAFRGEKNECESRLQRSVQHLQSRKS